MRCGECDRKNWNLINRLKAQGKIKAVVTKATGTMTHLEAQEDMLVSIIAQMPLLHAQVKEHMSWINGIMVDQEIKEVLTNPTVILVIVTCQEAQVDMAFVKNQSIIWNQKVKGMKSWKSFFTRGQSEAEVASVPEWMRLGLTFCLIQMGKFVLHGMQGSTVLFMILRGCHQGSRMNLLRRSFTMKGRKSK